MSEPPIDLLHELAEKGRLEEEVARLRRELKERDDALTSLIRRLERGEKGAT